MRLVLALALGLLASILAQAPQPDLTKHFQGLNATFVLLNGANGNYVRYDAMRAAERFAPCSTFKIPHTAILLESGVVPDPSFTLTYDAALKQPANWARDFDLIGAFKASALWYYQAMARRLGIGAEQEFVTRLKYGNGNTRGGLDILGNPFWVDGSLRVSANEQVDFLRRFHESQLGLSARTTALTKQIMLVEETPTWRLSAKTGACHPAGEETANWYVGYVERSDGVYYFALEMGDKDFGRAYSERVSTTRAILNELGILR